ncbi:MULTISPECIES: DUF2490 domain-containing protein [unclassified Arenibacter]|mgnify:CR=1 FL=1|uniref:DUF2490 domain-containing protein n=1 Tax=unclassified Arenibacter TaxID=2615047 RepID=UPI0008537F21|nr:MULTISPECIES: DUF2490 domain-containing protein [unclassified Arenibacter]MCK0135440.1 DUF2490 domain-containing protein [Arenibacter sp. S6351L]GBF21834.1 hypothetical protein C21_04023 [Arenibacter sp. NBRC 103722]
MSINKFHLVLFIVFSQFSNNISAQSSYLFGLLPSINVNYKLENDWSLNTKLESRHLLRSGEFNGIIERKYNYILTDLSMIAAKKVGLNSRVASGYLIRFEEEKLFHRFIQQYTVLQRLTNLRLAHRLSTDQTFSPMEKPEFRLRYRIASEVALDGQSVDPREFYFKFNNEYLNSWQDYGYDLEIRLVPLLGYNLKSTNKIEMGLDYRVNSFLNNNTRHSFWVNLNWFIEL